MAVAKQLKTQQLAELAYSSQYNRIELVVPHGMKAADFATISGRLFGDALAKLPRGCGNCFSGEDFFIRERLEHVLFVDLESMEIVRGG
jgi:hypothetical protein